MEVLLALIHKIYSRAERAAEKELLADLRRVRGKTGLLYRLAEAALAHPDETVRAALFPVVGPVTLGELVAEGRANESALRARTREKLCASYSHHYRSVIWQLLAALEFRSSGTGGDVVVEALAVAREHVDLKHRHYPTEAKVPTDAV
ncbi:MAG TPA: hypothetical protein VGJ14_04545, partial [Sporichthyaceae bacterium]